MEDWRSPRARIKRQLRKAFLHGAGKSGRWTPETAEERATVPLDTVPFFGHRIGRPGGLGQHHETRLGFSAPRPVFRDVQGLCYSAAGQGWHEGALVERYSLGPVRPAALFRPPPAHCTQLDRAAVVQCDQIYSYGDWVHCFLGTILAAKFPDVPVLVPAHIADKSYVQRDLERAGIRWQRVNDWVRVAQAVVLCKPNPTFYWSAREVAAFRATYAPDPPAPRAGSVCYLGRFDLKGETVARPFPSTAAADCISREGGRVVAQSDLNVHTASAFAADAETVVGDHGSGLLNIMFWRPRTVIELVVNEWWVNNNLFVAAGMGVENFAVLRVDGLGAGEIGSLIARCQAHFAAADAGSRQLP